ncbi:MAG TPA: Gfo/Idh/MocA family oxidoreductase [Candidatus Binataceae bacterium]|nr:Gfo/Idh/MocA family oxidoreductase [Candidatus Binataceae bacterium]
MKLEIVNHNGSVVEPANGSMLAPSSGDGNRVARSSTNGHILAPGSKEASAAAKPLRGLAVVGLGYWGPNWIRNFSTLQCAQRLVACDLNSERLSHLKELYPNLETSQKFEEVLQDPDIEGVVIATPVSTHYRMAKQCLETDKAVVVEKPLATSRTEAADLVRVARLRDRVLMVGHTFEYSAPVLKMRDLITSGEIGEVLYISSVRANLGLFQHDVNVTWDLAVHDISIILMLLGQMPESVSCQGQSHFRREVEDVALITLHLPHNVIAFVHVSWLDPNKIRRTTIVGSRQMLVYDDTALQEKIRIYDRGVTVRPYYDNYGEFQYAYRYGDIHIPRIEEVEPIKRECEHFVDCIRNNLTPATDGLNGLRVVAVLEAAQKSLRSGGASIPLGEGR